MNAESAREAVPNPAVVAWAGDGIAFATGLFPLPINDAQTETSRVNSWSTLSRRVGVADVTTYELGDGPQINVFRLRKTPSNDTVAEMRIQASFLLRKSWRITCGDW